MYRVVMLMLLDIVMAHVPRALLHGQKDKSEGRVSVYGVNETANSIDRCLLLYDVDV
jgi:hypothetical protein